MYQFARRGGVVVLVMLVLAGCIQPVETTQTPTPGEMQPAAMNPTPVVATLAPGDTTNIQPPTTAPNQAVTMIQQFVQGRGDVPLNLQVWYEQPRGPDQLQGFSYTGANGQPCAGFLLIATINGVPQPNNGALLCTAQPGAPALAGATLFATTDGQPYTIVFGRVEDPVITAIAVIFNDGSNQTVNPYLGGFLLLKAGIFDVNLVTAINAEGNSVIENIPLSPVS